MLNHNNFKVLVVFRGFEITNEGTIKTRITTTFKNAMWFQRLEKVVRVEYKTTVT